MKDSEIVKALECCKKPVGSGACNDCPLKHTRDRGCVNSTSCTTICIDSALDLINRQQAEIENCYQFIKQLEEARTLWDNKCNEQQAEIERLQNLTEKDFEQTAISTVKRHQKWIEYRAIKEFAERLKKAKQYSLERHENIVPVAVIDWIVKEMVGDTE